MPGQESTSDRVLGEVADLMGVTRAEVKWTLAVTATATALAATVAAVRWVLDALAEQELNDPSTSLRR